MKLKDIRKDVTIEQIKERIIYNIENNYDTDEKDKSFIKYVKEDMLDNDWYIKINNECHWSLFAEEYKDFIKSEKARELSKNDYEFLWNKVYNESSRMVGTHLALEIERQLIKQEVEEKTIKKLQSAVNLEGSEKQIAWGKDIRGKMIFHTEELRIAVNKNTAITNFPKRLEKYVGDIDKIEEKLLAEKNAEWFINKQFFMLKGDYFSFRELVLGY